MVILSGVNNIFSSDNQLLSHVVPIDIVSLQNLKRKLHIYRDHDEHLKELFSVLSTQEDQIAMYNDWIKSDNLTEEQQNIMTDASFKNLMEVSKTEVENLSELSSILMQGNNISPSWQIAKYGKILGTASFVKNLLLPRDIQSSFGAGVGALTAFVGFNKISKSPVNIYIYPPVGTEKITINNDESQQKIIKTLTACALGAGTVIAGTQLWNSWMHEKNSRNFLIDKIKSIKISNGIIGQRFDSIRMHDTVNRLDQNVNQVGLSTQSIQAGVSSLQLKVDRLTDLTSSQNFQLDEIVKNQQLTQDELIVLKKLFIQSGEKVDQMIQSLQDQFGEVRGLVLGNMMLQMKIHEENKSQFEMIKNKKTLSSTFASCSRPYFFAGRYSNPIKKMIMQQSSSLNIDEIA